MQMWDGSTIVLENENKFNKQAGLQSDNSPKLLARVELVEPSITNFGTEINTVGSDRTLKVVFVEPYGAETEASEEDK